MKSSCCVLFISSLLFACTGPSEDESLVDNDADGFTSEFDCDDSDSQINPNADELCDGIDNNCDGAIDDATSVDQATWYADEDGDGFGDPDATTRACTIPEGFTDDATDCDDNDATLRPDDQDMDGYSSCDGDCDDLDAFVTPEDLDGDGYAGCGGDCDDTRDNVYPAEYSIEDVVAQTNADAKGGFERVDSQTLYRDENDNVVIQLAESDYDNDGVIDQSYYQTSEYDADGRLLVDVINFMNIEFSFIGETEYTYDGEGRELTYSYREDVDRDGVWNYSSYRQQVYDAEGHLVRRLFEFDYDGDGKLDAINVNTYVYDAYGNVTREDYDSDNDGRADVRITNVYVYDTDGNVVERARQEDYEADGRIDSTRVYLYEYDADGNTLREEIRQLDDEERLQQVVMYVRTYDSANNVTSVRYTYDADLDGDPENAYRQMYTYNSENLLTVLRWESDRDGDGTYDATTVSNRTYDDQGNLLSDLVEDDYENDGVVDRFEQEDHTYTWACF